MANSNHRASASDTALRLSGALFGLLVFFGGVALLYYVYQTARSLFDAPPPTLPVTATASPAPVASPSPLPSPVPGVAPAPAPADTTSVALNALSTNLVDFLKRFLLLLLMCIAGSVIASRGIELFFKACAASVAPPPSSGTPSSSTATASTTASPSPSTSS